MQELAALGFAVDAISLLAIEPLETDDAIQAIKNQIMNLDNYAKVIFVSQNAVQYGMQWIDSYWPQMPIRLAFFAVGATTARQLASYGVQVEDLAQAAAGAMNSESLLQAASLQQVEDEKILIVRGQGGRGHLAEELRKRGAQVEYCEVYKRSLPDAAAADLLGWIQNNGPERQDDIQEQRLISVHSGESLQNLELLLSRLRELQQLSDDHCEKLKRTPLLVPGERVAAVARTLGWQLPISAENATDLAMTQALTHYCQSQPD
jgi:uroporphyrinogen-III synthase